VDAEAFQADYARNPESIRSELLNSPVMVVNKIDRVGEEVLSTVLATLRELNPTATCVLSRYGSIDISQLQSIPRENPQQEDENSMEAEDAARFESSETSKLRETQTWSSILEGEFDVKLLREFLEDAAAGKFGNLERVKGIVKLHSSWVRFDVSGGRVGMTAFTPYDSEVPRLVVIVGEGSVYSQRLEEALHNCVRSPEGASRSPDRVVALSS
jgi:G3E family GTPase